MKTQKVVAVMLAMLFIGVSASVCSALSKLEEGALHQEAFKLAKDTGMNETEIYQSLVLRYEEKQAIRVAENSTDLIDRRHANLRALVYGTAADTSMQLAFTRKVAKELLADLLKEQTEGAKEVSLKLSHRINGLGSSVSDTYLMAAKTSVAMVELASFEAVHACGIKKSEYAIPCSESLQKSVAEIDAAMEILRRIVGPFSNAVLLGNMKRFTH